MEKRSKTSSSSEDFERVVEAALKVDPEGLSGKHAAKMKPTAQKEDRTSESDQ